MVVGDHKKFVSALIVPSQDALKMWCEQHQIVWTSLPEIIRNEKVMRW